MPLSKFNVNLRQLQGPLSAISFCCCFSFLRMVGFSVVEVHCNRRSKVLYRAGFSGAKLIAACNMHSLLRTTGSAVCKIPILCIMCWTRARANRFA